MSNHKDAGGAAGRAGPAKNHYDALVVGGGHNGLTAAAYLARAGLKVLVLERRPILGGACVTEEVDPVRAPGCKVSFASYIASMLMPTVIRDLKLGDYGLKMVACDPILTAPVGNGQIIRWFADVNRTADEVRRFSRRDGDTFLEVDRKLKKLAAYLQPFFLEPPPDFAATGLGRVREGWRLLKRFHRISGGETAEMIAFLTGSLGEFLDRHFEAEETRRMFLANNVYGKHGGPYEQGSAGGLLFHLLAGGDHKVQGFNGHVMGGMGAITAAMAASARDFGAEIVADAPVARIRVEAGRATGVVLEDGTEIAAPIVLSNADPKRTFLKLVDPGHLPEDFRRDIAAIKMAGPAAKLNMVLSEEPNVLGRPADAGPLERSVLTIVPTLEGAQRCADIARLGDIPDELWIDCVVPSLVDGSLCPPEGQPGRHVMTCFIQYLPYRLREGSWEEKREALADEIIRQISRHMPNVPGAVIARKMLTPLDLEQRYALTEGNIFHGDLNMAQLFAMRPVPGWSQYRSPVDGLYLCGAGAHPGGGVTGAPGHNAAAQVLRDRGR